LVPGDPRARGSDSRGSRSQRGNPFDSELVARPNPERAGTAARGSLRRPRCAGACRPPTRFFSTPISPRRTPNSPANSSQPPRSGRRRACAPDVRVRPSHLKPRGRSSEASSLAVRRARQRDHSCSPRRNRCTVSGRTQPSPCCRRSSRSRSPWLREARPRRRRRPRRRPPNRPALPPPTTPARSQRRRLRRSISTAPRGSS